MAISGTLVLIGVCTDFGIIINDLYPTQRGLFIDAGTTVSAPVCTWMVTRKILENWLYGS